MFETVVNVVVGINGQLPLLRETAMSYFFRNGLFSNWLQSQKPAIPCSKTHVTVLQVVITELVCT